MPTAHADPMGDRETPRPAGHALTAEPAVRAVELMLRNLPDQHLEIIVATYFQRRTTREAARLLGLTPAGASGRRLWSAPVAGASGRLYRAMCDLSAMVAALPPTRTP